MSRVGVTIVYRDALFAEGLASLLRANGAVEVFGVVAEGVPALDHVRTMRPSVVIREGDPSEGEDPAFLRRLLETTPCVVEVGLNCEVAAVHQCAQVNPAGLGLDAGEGVVARHVVDLRRSQERLGRYAAKVNAGAA
jgi:DNA-binding NarL/FixJ family response regulator